MNQQKPSLELVSGPTNVYLNKIREVSCELYQCEILENVKQERERLNNNILGISV